MSYEYQPPLIPGLSQGPMMGNYAPTGNPFFSIANQFLPRNLHDVIRWARYITTQSPVVTEVIRKFSTYPITDFIVDTKSTAVKEKYQEMFKSFKLKATLHDIGFDYYTIGNVFVSIYFPIQRSLICPHCKTIHNAKQAEFTQFKQYGFHGTCPKCGWSGAFTVKDTKSTNIADMNIIKWDPLNIAVNHNPITNEYEYFYKIPNDIKRKVREGDKLFVNSVPWGFVEAIQKNQDFKFDQGNLFHLKNISAGHQINGIAMPPLISLYNLVFYQATLRRANESISTDFMNPLRVIFPQPQTGNSDPVVSISLNNFVSRMQEAVISHKQDKNHVLIAPVPIGYQAISGEGKTLLIAQEIEQAEESILLSLGVSRDLLSGQTNWTSSTIGLRLLENTLACYTGQIEELLEWIFTKVSKYLGMDTCSVTLTPFRLTDDDVLRQMLVQNASSGVGSWKTAYETFGMDYDEERRRKMDEQVELAVDQVRTKMKVEQASFLASKDVADRLDGDGEYKTALTQAQQISEELINMDESSRRTYMNELRVESYPIYLLVSKLIEEYRKSPEHQQQVAAELNNMASKNGVSGDSENSEAQGVNPSEDAAPGTQTGTDVAANSELPGPAAQPGGPAA